MASSDYHIYENKGEEQSKKAQYLLYTSVLVVSFAFSSTHTAHFEGQDSGTVKLYYLGQVIGAAGLGFAPLSTKLRLFIATSVGILGAILMIIHAMSDSSSAWFPIARVALGIWHAGALLSAYIYVKDLKQYNFIMLASLVGHFLGVIIRSQLFPNNNYLVPGILIAVFSGAILAFAIKSDLKSYDADYTPAWKVSGIVIDLVLWLFLFSSMIPEETLSYTLPSGESSLGWGLDGDDLFTSLSWFVSCAAILTALCANVEVKRLLGFAIVFASVGWFALLDFEDRNNNIGGMFASLIILSIALPLGKSACLASLQDLSESRILLTVFYLIGALLRLAGPIWHVRAFSFYDTTLMVLTILTLVILFVVFFIFRNQLMTYELEKKAK